MPTIEDRIEEMWEDPEDRLDRWLGFFGKAGYEGGVVSVIFVPILAVLVSFLALATDVSLVTALGVLLPATGLYTVTLNWAFCSLIGRD
ncbi:MAG: hypothetical protein ABEI98_10405 [Halorhabdus sp.]